MNSLVWLAVVLIVAWLILRLALAVTSGLLNLLWIIAIVVFIVWAFGKLRGRSS